MKATIFPVMLLAALGCESKHGSEPSPSMCNAEVNPTYIESTDATQNQAALSNVSSRSVSVAVDYNRTTPSNIEWLIEKEKLKFDGSTFQLSYSAGNSSWDVMSESGAIIGNLTPFKTEGCGAVSQLKLTMFVPAEEGLADISFANL